MLNPFTEQFLGQVETMGYRPEVLLDRIQGRDFRQVLHATRDFLDDSVTLQEIVDGLWQGDRDGNLPAIKQKIETVLFPWIVTQTTSHLPGISIKEISRMHPQTSPRVIFRTLEENGLVIGIRNQGFQTVLDEPSFRNLRDVTGRRIPLNTDQIADSYRAVRVRFSPL